MAYNVLENFRVTKISTCAYKVFHSHPVVPVSNVTILREDLIQLKFSSINFIMHTGGTSPGFIHPVQHSGTVFYTSIQIILKFIYIFHDVLKSQNIILG